MKQAILRSNGEHEARAYAQGTVPALRAPPRIEEERVVLTDPRRTETVSGSPAGAGPRNLNERVWPPPEAPGIELPDARPLTKAQRFWIDPELLEQWEQEEAERRRAGR
jgi:hypothetical protein